MYSQRIKDKAFELYCIHGGIKPVVGLLKKEFSACKNINRKTLTKWAAEDKWDERKANVREQIHEQHDQKIGEAIGDIEKRLQDEVDKVFTCLKDLEPKSFAEAIHSLPTMFTQLRKLRGEDGVTDVQQAISVRPEPSSMTWSTTGSAVVSNGCVR